MLRTVWQVAFDKAAFSLPRKQSLAISVLSFSIVVSVTMGFKRFWL